MAKRKASKAVQAKIDRLGALDAKLADINAERDAIANSLKSTLEPGYYEGARYSATITASSRSSVDVEALVRDYSIADLENYKSSLQYVKLTVSARDKQ